MDYLFDILAALFVIGTAAAVIYNWPEITNNVKNWLHNNNLDKSQLMSVLIFFDKKLKDIRLRLVVKTRSKGEQVIEEKTLTEEQLQKEDPEIYKLVQQRQTVSKDVTKEVIGQL